MTDPVVAIVTGNRPVAVERCLHGLIEGAGAQRRFDILVSDNSADGETENLCGGLGAGGRIDYRGASARSALARLLVAAGADATLVQFAIAPGLTPAVGANRNALLLFTAGRRLLSLDDDVVATLARASRRDSLHLADAGEPSLLEFPDPDGRYRSDLQSVTASLPDCHQDLGLSVADAVANAVRRGGSVHVDDGAAWLGAAEGRSPETIRITINGIEGGDGMGWPTRLLLLTGTSRENLLRDEATYRRAYMTSRIRRYVPAAVITPQVSCMSTCIGLDNTRWLPPFFPAFRSADPLFGRVVRRCDPEAVVMFTPEVVRHRPIEDRRRGRDDIWNRTRQRVTHLIGDILDEVHLPPELTDAERLVWLGRALAAAAGPPSVLREIVCSLWQRGCAARLERIARLRAVHRGHPRYWDDDITAHARRIEQETLDPDTALPVEAVSVGDQPAESWSRLQRWLDLYARLLQEWPAIWTCARTLAES